MKKSLVFLLFFILNLSIVMALPLGSICLDDNDCDLGLHCYIGLLEPDGICKPGSGSQEVPEFTTVGALAALLCAGAIILKKRRN